MGRGAWAWLFLACWFRAGALDAPCFAQASRRSTPTPTATTAPLPTPSPAFPQTSRAGGGQPQPQPSAAAPTPADGLPPPNRSPLFRSPETGAPLEPGDLRFPINLPAALRLSDARPLIVAAAQASVWVAEADLSQARVLWVPTLNIGGDYIRHDGGGPDFNKGILTSVSTNFFYGGFGLTGAPLGIIYTTDAVFQPLVMRQQLNARHWDVQASKNDALLMTADAYFRVHQYRGIYAGTLYCVERGHDLVGPGTWSPTSSSAPSWHGRSGGSRAPISRGSSGSTPAPCSSRWSRITSRSRSSTPAARSTT
jgi:hypothetical protein